MYNEAHLDFETRSTTDLIKAGVYRYVEDPNTYPWGFSYRFDREPNKRYWTPGDPDPVELLEHIRNGRTVKAHNASFERWVWNVVVARLRPHWPKLTIKQMDCTMARAAAVGHPQSLEKLAVVLGTVAQKDMQGSALMKKMMRPRKFNADGTIEWWDAPENIERLMQYCGSDVDTECDVDDKVPPLTEYERRVWELDQLINDRGIYIDLPTVEKLVVVVELAKKDADRVMRSLTDRAVPKCSNDNKIIEWIASKGIECTTVKKGEQDDLMFMADVSGQPKVREVIELRADSKKTSTAKYKAMTVCVCSDGRIRGLLNYHGAGPGRWAGRLIQPQNFPRMDPDDDEGFIFNWLAELAHEGWEPPAMYEAMTSVYGDSGDRAPLRLLSRALRSMICAQPGNKLVGGDFSNIEGRVNAWNAGEEWKLQAFRDYDAGTGPDLYRITAASITGKAIKDITGAERQAQGKVPELACGYQGSVGAFITMGANYDLDPYAVARQVKATTAAELWDATAAGYSKARDKCGLFENEWTAIKIVVNNWRAANPRIVQSWWDLQDAAIEAVSTPGVAVACTRITYYFDGQCLWCVLPSGRMICYAYPEIRTTQEEAVNRFGETYMRVKHTVWFWGFKEGQWRNLSLYGGLQCENIVQGIARCIMVDRMFAAEEAGYPLILTVHDELLAEVSAQRLDLNAKHLESVMSILPQFASGLPLAAKAWEDTRYVK